jgi:hypothetical protein
MIEDIKTIAMKTFRVINASGVSRIDFLIDDKNKKIYVNEINTIPGDLSSYLWMAKKMSTMELIEHLIKLAADEQKKKEETIYAFPGNLLEKYDILKGEKLKKLEKQEKEKQEQKEVVKKEEKQPEKEINNKQESKKKNKKKKNKSKNKKK